ncbi:uncharacterized protein LOC131852674 [Achroia grisella]|uniref:uncharacterized protein LOC131852674 n=1 Tax=Achroia grisella TaxID=688607 RepID=UPI0027D2F78E|nr:uncharacterized protein LOC131852674 [Achroia grisella]
MTNSKDKKKRSPDRNHFKRKEKICVWCDKNSHASSECATAICKNLDKRKEYLRLKNACYICLNIGHTAKKCRKYPKCVVCMKRHFPIMCSDVNKPNMETNTAGTSQSVPNQGGIPNKTVLLQTLKAKICNGNENITVRVLLDSGAQQTFVTKDVAYKLKLKACDIQEMSQNLFGGTITQKQMHKIYNLTVKNLDGTYECKMRAFEKATICSNIPMIKKRNDILSVLKEKGVFISDPIDDVSKIDLLIGSDFLGTLLTGRLVQVQDYLFATETKLGWTIQGHACDNAQTKTVTRREEEVGNFFRDTICINEENRYEVRLPWKETGDILSPNYEVALKRLNTMTAKLSKIGLLSEYDQVFNEWLESGIIEIVENSSLTTKIRPVFDASASTKKGVSLNSCLEKGSNLIEDIPRLQFRKGAIGITSVIKKAFLQLAFILKIEST